MTIMDVHVRTEQLREIQLKCLTVKIVTSLYNFDLVLTWPFGKWPVATIISQDKKEKLRRLMIQMLEMGSVVTRQRAQETGNDTITQFIILADIEGFGYGSHACFSCMKNPQKNRLKYLHNPEFVIDFVIQA